MVKTSVPPGETSKLFFDEGETSKLGIMASACDMKIYCEPVALIQ